MKEILIINGPNLNLLGKREIDFYGSISFEEYYTVLKVNNSHTNLSYFQSNHEGDLIDKIHEVGFDINGIVINAGAYTHTSIAIRDAIKAIPAPVVEVHISNIYEREKFRRYSFLEDVCKKMFVGKGLPGYQEAIDFLVTEY
ncbi:MAG: 3-dehydroquinate dehydratase [Saprospiraceae bacterium]|nr:3-dehydroquinate dehydratase [Saprospiraceae bacterium]